MFNKQTEDIIATVSTVLLSFVKNRDTALGVISTSYQMVGGLSRYLYKVVHRLIRARGLQFDAQTVRLNPKIEIILSEKLPSDRLQELSRI